MACLLLSVSDGVVWSGLNFHLLSDGHRYEKSGTGIFRAPGLSDEFQLLLHGINTFMSLRVFLLYFLLRT